MIDVDSILYSKGFFKHNSVFIHEYKNITAVKLINKKKFIFNYNDKEEVIFIDEDFEYNIRIIFQEVLELKIEKIKNKLQVN